MPWPLDRGYCGRCLIRLGCRDRLQPQTDEFGEALSTPSAPDIDRATPDRSDLRRKQSRRWGAGAALNRRSGRAYAGIFPGCSIDSLGQGALRAERSGPTHRRLGIFQVLHAALPDDQHIPTKPAQRLVIAFVPRLVGVDLRPPEFNVRRRELPSFAPMSVPEAPVHKDRSTKLREDEVGATGKIGPMNPETKPKRVRGSPDEQLGLGVLALHRSHVSRSLNR